MDTANSNSASPDLSSTPASPDAARAALDTLRLQRLEGRVTEQDYLTRAEFLSRAAAGEKLATPPDPFGVTQDQRFAQQYSDQMAPPSGGHEYGRLDAMSSKETQAADLDAAVRSAFLKAGIPRHLGAPLVEAVNRISYELAPFNPQVIEARMQSTSDGLKQQWGDSFTATAEGVADLVCDLADADPIVGEIIDRAPWLITANQPAMEYLGRIVQHRSRAR